PSDVAQAVQIQADGKVLVAGGTGSLNSSDRFQVVRFNSDGSPDDGSSSDTTPGDSFGTAGRAVPLSGGILTDMVLQPDGRILLAGTVAVTTGSGKTAVTQYDIALVRLLPNGQVDTSFDQDGKVVTGVSISGNRYDEADAVTLQADGRILVGGLTTGADTGLDSLLLRYNSDGSLDSSFGQG